MARGGKRMSLAELTNATGVHSPVDGEAVTAAAPKPAATGAAPKAPLDHFAPNPRNPRDDLGDLSSLSSIAEMQLQPVLVVTRAAYLELHPGDEPELGTARWVVINGCRRLAAAHVYGVRELEYVVKDAIASTAVTLLAAAVLENIERRDFDIIEEAKAVEELTKATGSADAAAAKLKRSKAWVSQRRALLKLVPELQAALRNGELAFREARSLAVVPLEEQVARWQAERERSTNGATAADAAPSPTAERPSRSPGADPARIAKTLKRWAPPPADLAAAIRGYMPEDQVQALIAALSNASRKR